LCEGVVEHDVGVVQYRFHGVSSAMTTRSRYGSSIWATPITTTSSSSTNATVSGRSAGEGMALNINAFWGVPSPRQGWLNHLH
jgi:hypothetical protein